MKHAQYCSALIFAAMMTIASATTVAMAEEAKGSATAKHEHGPGTHQHEAKKKDHHDPAIKKQDFGTTTVASLKFESITQEGAIMAGEEGAFDVVIAEGQKPPKAMRAWIGVASGQGSVKTKLEKEPNRHYHSHVEVPETIPAGSQYWLEVEPEKGPKAKTSFTYFTEE